MTYWCEEDGDISDPQLVFVLVRLLSIVSPDTLNLVFSDRGYIETGRALARYFTELPGIPDNILMIPPERLTPGVYQFAMRHGDLYPHYLSITDISDPSFSRVFSFTLDGDRITSKGEGYYIYEEFSPLYLSMIITAIGVIIGRVALPVFFERQQKTSSSICSRLS